MLPQAEIFDAHRRSEFPDLHQFGTIEPPGCFRIGAAGFPLVSKKGLWLELIQVVCHPLTQAEHMWFPSVPLGSLGRRIAIKAGILDHGQLQRADQQRF